MLDVGSASASESSEDDADLAVFVDRLAAAGSDRPTALARAEIRRAIAAGYSPPGLRRLAEALAASVAELPPPPRRPTEDSGSVVTAMRGNALVVLEDFDDAAIASAVAALLADGRRVVVTASTPAGLAAVRDVLPAEAVDRALDRLPALAAGELRELRRLLATATPAQRARAEQQLPPTATLPSVEDVAELAARAVQSTGPEAAAGMVPGLLSDLEAERRDAVTSVAGCVSRSLGALPPRSEHEWPWALLSDLIYSRHRAVFDRMLEDTAQAVTTLERLRGAPAVNITAPLPAGAAETLRRYREFLEAGGRSRAYFRSPVQREVQPLLRLITVGDRTPETEAELRRVLEHLELGERLGQVDIGCAEIGIDAPRDEAGLLELADALVKVAAAARSVGALRHDVLFIAPNSPLSVPDVETAEQVAGAILDYAEHGSSAEAERRLDRLADELADRYPVPAMSPEHEQAVAALRERDATAYAAAVEALEAAHREMQDESRRVDLLSRLAEASPQLAEAWTTLGEHDPAALGFASFVPMDTLLAAVPPSDSADAVLVLGAAALGVERLLLTAVAPRLVAAVRPGERTESSPSLLSVLQRASALVIRGRAAGNASVVPFGGGGGARQPSTRVGQAGA